MNKERKILVIVLLLLLCVSGTYAVSTYAKYISELSASGTVKVAKWNFESDNQIDEITVDLAETYDASTLTDGYIAPGTSGSFEIELKNTSDVAVEWSIAIDDIENLPENIKFYSDAEMNNELALGTDTITGTLKAKEEGSLKPTVYWAWAYETLADGSSEAGDAADTSAGETGGEFTIAVTITGVQMAPSTTAVESKINE